MTTYNITSLLQTQIKSFMTSCESLSDEVAAIEDAYFKSGADSDISALNASDPVTVSTKLTKTEFTNGITLCQDVSKFFQNTAVSTGDRLSSIYPIYYGNDEASSIISVAVEALGSRMYDVCSNLLTLYNSTKTILGLYFDNEVGDVVAVLESDTIIYGSDMTTSELSSAITMIQEFQDMIANAAVTQADYQDTVEKWRRIA